MKSPVLPHNVTEEQMTTVIKLCNDSKHSSNVLVKALHALAVDSLGPDPTEQELHKFQTSVTDYVTHMLLEGQDD